MAYYQREWYSANSVGGLQTTPGKLILKENFSDKLLFWSVTHRVSAEIPQSNFWQFCTNNSVLRNLWHTAMLSTQCEHTTYKVHFVAVDLITYTPLDACVKHQGAKIPLLKVQSGHHAVNGHTNCGVLSISGSKLQCDDWSPPMWFVTRLIIWSYICSLKG